MEEGLKEYSVERVRVGDVLKGEIISVNEKELAVNVNYRADGIVPAQELPNETTEGYKVGDSIEVMVVSTYDNDGNLLLSVIRAYATVVWEEFEQYLESGEVFEVDVKEVTKGGVVAKYKGARVFIPASLVSATYVKDLSQFVGQKLKVQIVDLDKSKRRAVASAKALAEEARKAEMEEKLATLKVGDVVKGKVVRIESYGAFVDLGGIDGLLHVSNMSWKRIKHPTEIVKSGDDVEVEITKIDTEKQNISLKLSDIPENPWDSVEVKFHAGEIYKGTVTKVQPYGAFIKLAEDIEGLCHISELAEERVAKTEDIVNVGDEVEVRVLSVDSKARKISLSIKSAKDTEYVELPKEEGSVELGIKPTTLADLFADKLDHLKK